MLFINKQLSFSLKGQHLHILSNIKLLTGRVECKVPNHPQLRHRILQQRLLRQHTLQWSSATHL